MESTLRKTHLKKYISELSAPLSRAPRLERSSDLCSVHSLPMVVRGAARCSHELEFYTSSHCVCSLITELMNTSSLYHQDSAQLMLKGELRWESLNGNNPRG